MEKINIAELLKDCPKGMELDCSVFEDVTLYKIDTDIENEFPIRIKTKNDYFLDLTKYGTYSNVEEAKCVIFPKGKTTWEGFQRPFKDGDIVTYKYENGLVSMILKKFVNFVEIHHHCALYDNAKGFVTNNYIVGEPKYIHLATEEEKQKLFDAIEMNGYKWNAETKTLEKLIEPKFKVGDKVLWNYNTEIPHVISKMELTSTRGYVYWIDCKGSSSGWWSEDELTPIPSKFDITTLKPYDKVLVRDNEKSVWRVDFFSHYNNDGCYKYVCVGYTYRQCIPYNEETANLVNTTNDCDDFYKTWEK